MFYNIESAAPGPGGKAEKYVEEFEEGTLLILVAV
jgi:hypothetical protein